MRHERRVLRLGEFLVGRACRRLPAADRDNRYREWAAELPAILDDPGTRPGWLRAARMLAYASGTLRAAALARSRRHRAGHAWLSALRSSPGLLPLVVILASLQAAVVYLTIFGTRLEVFAAIWGVAMAAVTHHLLTRQGRGDFFARIWLTCWALWASGNLFAAAARKLGWPAGPPVLPALGNYAMGAITLIELVALVRPSRRRRRVAPRKTR